MTTCVLSLSPPQLAVLKDVLAVAAAIAGGDFTAAKQLWALPDGTASRIDRPLAELSARAQALSPRGAQEIPHDAKVARDILGIIRHGEACRRAKKCPTYAAVPRLSGGPAPRLEFLGPQGDLDLEKLPLDPRIPGVLKALKADVTVVPKQVAKKVTKKAKAGKS